MYNRIQKSRLGKIFEKLYQSEINIRFEWWADNGFTWSIVTSTEDHLPRVLLDDEASAGCVLISKSMNYDEHIGPPVFVEPDWARRGNDQDIEVALYDLVQAVCEIYPNSTFATWFKETENER